MTDVEQPPAPADSDKAGAPAAGGGRRKAAVGGLVVLGSVMLCIAIFATWLDRVALDSNTWSDTSAQALQQPAVRTALSTYLVDQLYTHVNIPKVLSEALPAKVKPLAGPIAVAGEPYVQRAVAAGLARPRVAELWRAANLRAHGQLMTILNGGSGPFSTANGTVSIDLSPLVGDLSNTLTQHTNGAVSLPPGTGKITLLRSKQLGAAQTGVKLLRLLSIPLMLLALVVFGIAVAISRDRRKALRAIAWGILAAAVVLILIRRVVGDTLIDSLTTLPDARAAGHAIWWVATDRLGNANVTTCCVGLLLLAGTWFAGPSRHATAARKHFTPYLRDPNVAYGAYAGIVLVLLVWAPVNAARDPLIGGILILLGAAGVEALRRLVIREFPDDTERTLGHRLGHFMDQVWESLVHREPRQPATAAAPAGAPSRYDDLERLVSLHDRGALDDQEFATEKTALLAGMK